MTNEGTAISAYLVTWGTMHIIHLVSRTLSSGNLCLSGKYNLKTRGSGYYLEHISVMFRETGGATS